MERDTHKTVVVFRKFRNGEVIALFPELPHMIGNWDYCSSYMHVGQHGAASPHGLTWNHTSLAKPDEYAALQTELESIGYNLTVRQRVTRKMDYARRDASKEAA